ncbi:MAG: N-6 DNA methylase [bacterium]
MKEKPKFISKNLISLSRQVLCEKLGSNSDAYLEFTNRLKNLLLEKVDIKEKVDNWTKAMEGLYGYQPTLSFFVDHVYLIVLAKIATYLKFNNNRVDKKEILGVINGEYFIRKGITNFEDDFLSCFFNPKIEKEFHVLVWNFIELLSNYNFSRIEEDIFRELYEEIIERKERHKIGEYYTPEWLTKLILNDTLALWEKRKKKTTPKILDPACGSGTFLYCAIKMLIKKGVSCEDIVKNVHGIDINPIAVIIAKTNYLIAISDLIDGSKEMVLPIYTRDSLKSPSLFDYERFEKYDMLISNPPWVVMRSIKNREYQGFLKREVLNYHLVENKDVHLFTQMEMATLFFCKCADLYLEKDGLIAFVMPKSVLAGTIHHINFRKFRNPPIKLFKILDLEGVNPLFNMPSCVLIGSKGEITKYPVLMEIYKGELSNRNGKLLDVKEKLSVAKYSYTPPDFSLKPSYYYSKFKVGASIFPRSFYFIDFKIPSTTQSSGLVIKTSDEIYKIVKNPWNVILEGNIEEDFLYTTLLAWEIFPFGYVKMNPVVIPIKENFSGFRLMNINSLQKNGKRGITEWFNKAQAIWNERRTEKSEKRFPSLLDRLNYNGLLTVQNPFIRYLVLYNATGTDLASCVIDKHSLPCFEFNGIKVKSKGFIVDVKTWFFETENENEAYYLCSILNSEIISKMIKPLQPRGLFGARAIHRRPLLFPIPKFNEYDSLHNRLANIGEKCQDKIKTTSFIQRNNSIRLKARNKLKDEIMEINQIVLEILKI